MKRNRIHYIDFGAGIMIIWMIIYHALCYAEAFIARGDNSLNPCVEFPYLSFFMPWFFYKSGQFFDKRIWTEHLTKDVRKLLLTFAIWSAIGYAMFLLFGTLNHSLTLRSATYSIVRGLFLTGKVPINEPLWFLLTLFGVRVVANAILPEKNSKYIWPIIITIAIFGYAGAYLAYRFNHPLLPYWVANGASGIVFFALGYALSNLESKWWVIVPCVLAYIICCYLGFPMVDMMYNQLIAGNYILWIPVAFCGIVVFNMLCQWITKYVHITPIELVGQNAMTIYITHILIVISIQFVITYCEITKLYPHLMWVFIGGYVIFLPILCYLVPKVPILVGRYKSEWK